MEVNQAKQEEDLPTTLLPSHMYNRRLLGLTLAYPSLNFFSGSRFIDRHFPRVSWAESVGIKLASCPCPLIHVSCSFALW